MWSCFRVLSHEGGELMTNPVVGLVALYFLFGSEVVHVVYFGDFYLFAFAFYRNFNRCFAAGFIICCKYKQDFRKIGNLSGNKYLKNVNVENGYKSCP